MDNKWIIFYYLWILAFNELADGCIFYSKNNLQSESDGVRFIRVREDLPVEGEVLTLLVYPRKSIILKGMDRSIDNHYFKIREVNTTTIQVILNKSLEDLVDRDVPQNLLKFKIQCSSNSIGKMEETSFLTVTVYVEDINDNTPKFVNTPYNANVDESAAIGSTIFHDIKAFDKDKPNTPNSDIQYSLGAQDFDAGGPFFSMESPHRPSIVLRRKLDFDYGLKVFSINVLASDRGTPPKVANTTLNIFVNDIDDLPPRFSQEVYRTQIKEFTPITGQPIHVPLYFEPPIQAFDQDSFNATIIYDIVSGNERGIFRIAPSSGLLFLEKEIDLEQENLYGNTFVLQIEARQKHSQLKRALARIDIEIIDLNDNLPEFEVDLYNISIVENLPNGFSVLQVNAFDRDQGENAEFFYRLNDEKPSGAFLIDPRTGWITVQNETLLDREVRRAVVMTVEAIEKVPHYDRKRIPGTVRVEIYLLDANDNTPEFELGNLYEFKVNVETQIGEIIGVIRATDPDDDSNGDIIYEISPKTNKMIPFRLDPSNGTIIVTGALQPGKLALFVMATDQPKNPSERRFSLAVVTIDIAHKYDGSLDFIGAPYEFYISADAEIGVSVGQVRTTIGGEYHGNVAYDLLHSYPSGVPFAIEERSGIVTVIRSIQNFNRQMYEFETVAAYIADTRNAEARKNQDLYHIEEGFYSNGGNYENIIVTNVTIHVVDPSDEKGILFKNSHTNPIEFRVRENLENNFIGQLFYDALTPNKTVVKKKPKPNIRNIRRDRQILSSSRVTSAKTGSNLSDARRIIRKVRRKLRSVTEEPLIDHKLISSRAILANGNQSGFHLIPSPNIPQNLNESIAEAYRQEKQSKDISSASSLKFLIANQQDVMNRIMITSDGKLMTIRPLDREERDVYHLTVIAEYSNGFSTGAGIYHVNVYVDDVNDNAPAFNHNFYIGLVSENCALGTELMLSHPVMVSDKDSGVNSEFEVNLLGEGSKLFTVERRNISNYLGSSNRSLSLTENAIMSIDTNVDIEKNFLNMQTMFIEANRKALNEPHYVVKYTGPSTLDRETHNNYNLKLVSKDRGGLTSEVQMRIFITDVNDNAPVFEKIAVFKNAEVKILEYTDVMEIYFVDKMEPIIVVPERKVDRPRPIFKNNKHPNAGINHHVRKAIPPRHVGTPRLYDTEQINSEMTTPNQTILSRGKRSDKPASKSSPLFSIPENIDVATVVLKVTATDDDYDVNSHISYNIESQIYIPSTRNPRHQTTMNFFSIDRLSGEIKINQKLPAESEIRLNISAKDIGGLTDTTMVRFRIIDVNDNPPVFKKNWYSFDVEEGFHTGKTLGTIEATDEDFGQNANITFSIIRNSSNSKQPFLISPTDGVLKAYGELDREIKSLYEFKIMATDNSEKYPRMTSTVEIEVNILDKNDNSPEFVGYDEMILNEIPKHTSGDSRKLSNIRDEISSLELVQNKMPLYKVYLNRSTPPGTSIKQVTAADKDFTGNGNGLVMYSLHYDKLPYLFQIDSRDGVITTVSKLNNFHGYEHLNLTVIASDLGSPSMSSSALVLINLQGDVDEEDNEYDENHVFYNKYYEIEIYENNPVPLFVMQLNTSSLYQEEQFRWSVESEMGSHYDREFDIDPVNGTLWLVKQLDRERRDLYRLKIRAEKETRRGRNYPVMMYPISGERIRGLMYNEVRVVVRVQDQNDNSPFFVGNGRPIIAAIPSTASFGFPVVRVHASDTDAGHNSDIRYSLLNEPSQLFGIDPLTGRIRVLTTISKNHQKVYGFDVKATDRGGAEDGKSAIANVFVYILNANRQVRLVMSGSPVEVEKEVDILTHTLSDASGYEIKVRMLEPSSAADSEATTDVYIYAIDPKSNSLVDMEQLQQIMGSLNLRNMNPALPIIELAKLETPRIYPRNNHIANSESLQGRELASIVLAVTIFAGGLATALCIVCVRYKRQQNLITTNSQMELDYSDASRTHSTIQSVFSKSSNMKNNNYPTQLTARNMLPREPLFESPQEKQMTPSLIMSNLKTLDKHDSTCLRFNQVHSYHNHSNFHQSHEPYAGVEHEIREHDHVLLSQEKHNNNLSIQIKDYGMHDHHNNDNSSDSYDDSLKDLEMSLHSIPTNSTQPIHQQQQQQLPKHSQQPAEQRNPLARRGMRHSFSGFYDDYPPSESTTSSNLHKLSHQKKYTNYRSSMTDLDYRSRNYDKSAYVLNNSHC